MISAISRTGIMRFMVTECSVGADVFCQFIDRLAYKSRKKIFLIVDGHPVHRSKRVREHIDSLNGKVVLIRFPAYSPETNPDELVWNTVKSKIGRSFISGPNALKSKAIGALRWLQKSPEIIKAFFDHPDLAYISF